MHPSTTTKLRTLSTLGLASFAALCVSTGIARADTASLNTAGVQFQATTLNKIPSLRVTVTDTGGNRNPGTYGSCTFNATPRRGPWTSSRASALRRHRSIRPSN